MGPKYVGVLSHVDTPLADNTILAIASQVLIQF